MCHRDAEKGAHFHIAPIEPSRPANGPQQRVDTIMQCELKGRRSALVAVPSRSLFLLSLDSSPTLLVLGRRPVDLPRRVKLEPKSAVRSAYTEQVMWPVM